MTVRLAVLAVSVVAKRVDGDFEKLISARRLDWNNPGYRHGH